MRSKSDGLLRVVVHCKEDKNLELEDGAVRIFLNTRGTNHEDISLELREFLSYIESPEGEFVKNSNSDRLKKIHACVNRIKSSEEAGVKYMQKVVWLATRFVMKMVSLVLFFALWIINTKRQKFTLFMCKTT